MMEALELLDLQETCDTLVQKLIVLKKKDLLSKPGNMAVNPIYFHGIYS